MGLLLWLILRAILPAWRAGGQVLRALHPSPEASWTGSMFAPAQTSDALQRVLVQAHGLTEAAEAPGTLVGTLCASRCTLSDWLAEILPDGRAEGLAAADLRAVFDSTAGALVEGT